MIVSVRVLSGLSGISIGPNGRLLLIQEEPFGSNNSGEFCDQLIDHQLPKKEAAMWEEFI